MIDKSEVRRLLGKGLNKYQVAKKLGCSRQYVTYVTSRPSKEDSRMYVSGLAARKVNLASDPDFYRKIGRKGGKNSALARSKQKS